VGGDEAGLHALADRVRRELRRARLPHDRKPFRPHLTISRPGARVEPELIAADVATLAGYVGPEWTVDAVHLVASELGPHPRHTRLSSSRPGPP
jgi:2'-5' RNA ligase